MKRTEYAWTIRALSSCGYRKELVATTWPALQLYQMVERALNVSISRKFVTEKLSSVPTLMTRVAGSHLHHGLFAVSYDELRGIVILDVISTSKEFFQR